MNVLTRCNVYLVMQFPSMASLQGALPNVAGPAGLMRTSSLDTPSPTWMQSQSSHLPGMPPLAPSFAPTMSPSNIASL